MILPTPLILAAHNGGLQRCSERIGGDKLSAVHVLVGNSAMVYIYSYWSVHASSSAVIFPILLILAAHYGGLQRCSERTGGDISSAVHVLAGNSALVYICSCWSVHAFVL